MTEIEPTIDNVTPGAVVTIERGGPGKPGHTSFTHQIVGSPGEEVGVHEATVGYVQGITESDVGFRITRITRPAPQIPTTPGERFWAVGSIAQKPREYLVTDTGVVVALDLGAQWDLADFPYTVVPAPEPETVPVPVDLIREVVAWADGTSTRTSGNVLSDIVQAVQEQEGES